MRQSVVGTVLHSVTAALARAVYPARPVTLAVPFAPAGGADTGARLIAQKLGERWAQPLVAGNRAGAAGVIGVEMVAKAKPDGSTELRAGAVPAACTPAPFEGLIRDDRRRDASLIAGQHITIESAGPEGHDDTTFADSILKWTSPTP